MLRRHFFRLAVLVAPQWAWAQGASSEAMRELAAVVLPSSLGRKGTDAIADDFIVWIRDYKEGVPMAASYGSTKTTYVPASPTRLYAQQLSALTAAFAKGDKRAAVDAALKEAGADRIPNRPAGKHVAADLLAHFYNSPAGEDFLYGLAIRRSECRGNANAGERPARLTF